MAGRVFIGTSGWNYKHWANDVFYPSDLKQGEWFSYYTQHFNTVEMNNTFYNLPSRRVFENWREESPDKFSFAIKASRYITHIKKLKDPETSVVNFLENAKGLGEKLGVVLFQLPGAWKFNAERLDAFFRFVREQDIIPNLRASLEVRNPTWNCDECFDILRKYGVSLVLADWSELKITGPVTSDFVFVRRHGPEERYASSYSEQQLKRDAEWLKECVNGGSDAFVYFNNDANGYAVKNGLRLMELVGQTTKTTKKKQKRASRK